MATARVSNPSYSSTNGNREQYICDCGRKCTTQIELNEHKATNCEKRALQCSFCQESQPSSRHLSEHLMQCGNKTDQCPNCQKYIRRAIFAYHYENDCANLDEPDNPTPPTRISSTQRPSSNISKPVSKNNDFIDDDQENNNESTTTNDQLDKLQRISSATSRNKSPTDIKECKYCQHRCLRSDYKAHKTNCLKNPENLNKDQQRTSFIPEKPRPSTNESRRSKDIVRIPCEFCNESIDLNLLSTHTEDCRKREKRRLEARAKAINDEPVPEKFPCEHCEELFSMTLLRAHEIVCLKNPEYRARLTRPADTKPITTPSLFNELTNTQRHPTLSSTYSSLPSSYASAYDRSPQTQDILDRIRDRESNATLRNRDRKSDAILWNRNQESDATLRNEYSPSYVTINTKPSQERSRSRDRDLTSLGISGYQPHKEPGSSDNIGSSLVNSSHQVPAYTSTTSSFLTNNRLLSGTQSLPRRPHSAVSLDRSLLDRKPEERRAMPQRAESPNIDDSRWQSASGRSVDARGSYRSQATKATGRLTGDPVLFHSPREGDLKYQPKLNQPDRPTPHHGIFRRTPFFNPTPWRN